MLWRYGRLLTRLERYEAVEDALLEAHDVLKREAHPLAKDAAEALADCYLAWGKPQRATAWRRPPAGTPTSTPVD